MTQASQSPKNNLHDTYTLVQSYLRNCRDRGLSYHTIRWYQGFLIPFAEAYPELPSSPEVIQQFIGRYTSSDERRHGCYRTLKAFYRYIEQIQHDYIGPFGRIRAPKVKAKEKPYLSLEQLKKLLEYPYHYPAWVKPCLYVLADTGARIGEVSRLTKADILNGDNGPLIRLTGKTGTRLVPLSPYVRDMLLAMPKEKLFPGSVDWLIRQITKAFKKVGIPGSSSLLRHTFCSLWEGDIVSLRAITGHTNIRMVENYRHNKLGHATRQHQQYSPISLLNGGNSNAHNTQSANGDVKPITIEDGNVSTIVDLAKELGAAKERIKYLESLLNINAYQVVIRHN